MSIGTIREQIEARMNELKLELAKCEQLLSVLDESPAKPAKPKPTKAKSGTTAVAKVKPPTTESDEAVVEEIAEPEDEDEEPVESKAKASAKRNGGDSIKRQQVMHMLDEGMKPKEIAEATGYTISYVYSVKREYMPGR